MAATKKVLLVDDDADFVAMNQAVLERNGYQVCAAYNGKECIEKVEAERPDLIVLDVMMTRVSEGFDLSRELRNGEQTKDIPLIMVTSINATMPFKYEQDDTWLPVDTFIEKPVTPERLLAEVAKRLDASPAST